jgi:hypothetical protein
MSLAATSFRRSNPLRRNDCRRDNVVPGPPGHHDGAEQEHELGSIAAGKLANFTILGEDPYAVEPERLDRITVPGTVYAGRWFPACG